jgi:hypothetical protein
MTTLNINPFHPLSLDQPAYYWIEIQGRLDVSWSANFSGMVLSVAIIPGDGKKTILQGMVADQATLHGILNSIRDLGLPLLKVEYLPVFEADVQGE